MKRIILILIVLFFCTGMAGAEIPAKDRKFFTQFIEKKRDINKIKLKYLKRLFPLIGLSEKEAETVYEQKEKESVEDYSDLKDLGFSDKKIEILAKYFTIKPAEAKKEEKPVKEEKPGKEKPPEKVSVSEKSEGDTSVDDLSEVMDEQEVEEEEEIESLQKYLDKPLDLNKALRAELMELPEVSPLISVRIIKYRQDNNGFKSVADLKNVEGIDEDIFNKLKNYVTVGFKDVIVTVPSGEKVIKREKLKDKDFSGRMILRMYTRRPMDDAYSRRDIGDYSDRDLSYKFLYNRFDLNFFKFLHMEFMGERDYGEQGLKPGNSLEIDELKIYDMVMWNVYIDKVGPIERLLVGDYKMEIAQGLLFEESSKLAILQNSIYKSPVKKKDRGIKPHHSAFMSRALYGAAAQFHAGPVMILPFISQKKWDSQLKDRDDDDNDNDGIDNVDDPDKDGDGILDTNDPDIEYSGSSSIDDIIQYSGGDNHRTDREIGNRENFTEDLYGGRVKLKFNNERFSIGGTYYQAEYNHLVDPEFSERDKYYEFRGRGLNGGSVDFDLYIRNFDLYGEVARSWYTIETWQTNKAHPDFSIRAELTNLNGTEDVGYGKVFGLISDFKVFRLSSFYFDLDPNFYSPHANVFNENDRNIQGVLQGIYGKLSPDLKVWGYAEFYKKKWRSWDQGNIPYKQEYKGGFENRITRRVSFYWQGTYQFGTDQYDPDERRRLVMRYQLDWTPVKIVQFRMRYENTTVRYPYRNEPSQSEFAYGDVGYTHVKIKPTSRLTLYSRLMYFYTTDFDAAVYVYENELSLWPVPVRSFSGKGYRFFIYMSNRMTKEFSFEAKYSVTHDYSLERTIDSSDHDYRFQVIYKW
ncbi:MAG: helix-hairpin-helix domain-containing protein [Spirochaetes bacterium]|nr:helix-hairpin-helix domain-containing protein [Spirochaetota bacterium]